MPKCIDHLRQQRSSFQPFRPLLTLPCAGLVLLVVSTSAQTQPAAAPAPAPSQTSSSPSDVLSPSQTSNAGSASPVADTSAGKFTVQTVHGEVKEEQLKQLLMGKPLYLRNGYQDNSLDFDEYGKLVSHSPRGSYTLSQIQINKVKLTKHKLELQGDRYALHFLGAAPFDDPTAATDRVKITPKKKSVHISIEREEVEKPKKEKKEKKEKESRKQHNKESAETQNEHASLQARPADPVPQSLDSRVSKHDSGDKKKAASEAQSTQLLLNALDAVFAPGIDQRMISAMPDFWKLYYQAAAAKVDYKPADPGIYRQNDVDQKAKLISVIDPPSNEMAQKNGIAGIALYHAIVGSDGKVDDVVASRPIGFGLDENAEQSIRKAVFQPAVKGGKPVPVMLDLVVSFRIYSKRTSQPAPTEEASDKASQPSLPGPYTLQDEKDRAAAQPQTQTAAPQPAPQQ